jgi:hypothetical protein
LTGLSQLKNLGSAFAMFAVDGIGGALGGLLRLTTGAGRLAASAVGLSQLATSMTLVAGAGRLLMGFTGLGAALFVGYEVISNWDKLAAAAERVWKALKQLSHGDTSGVKSIANDVAKKIGIEQPKDARITQPHGRFGPGFHGFGASTHGMSALIGTPYAPHFTDAQARMANVHDTIQRAQQAVRVNVTVAPIQVNSKVDVKVSGQVNGPVQGTATVSSAATAPRGTATAEGSYGHVR